MDKGFSKRENPEMKRRRYTSEFKREAARMLIIEGLGAREVSEQLGVAENILYRWKQEHIKDLEANKPTGGQSPKEMAEEIEQLRKQLAKSQRMNAILKKTVGYFSKED
jgi:transposase